MAKRLNDTAALTSRPLEGGESRSISTRKIDNGFIVSESYYNPNTGECRNREEFTKTPPKIGRPESAERSGEESAGSRGLADTMDYLASHGKGERGGHSR